MVELSLFQSVLDDVQVMLRCVTSHKYENEQAPNRIFRESDGKVIQVACILQMESLNKI